ncbi:MAG: hypothetical protein O3C40_24405 [Planctomycetota bacterium]|nr:hypothetical protein [Planctomycetota bacterium]
MRIRFGLREFLLGCAVVAIVVAISVKAILRHDEFQRSIVSCSQAGTAGFNHDNVAGRFYDDHRGQLVAGLLCVYDFDAEVPTIQHDYAYGDWGGVLTVDGKRVVPGDIPWLFVNGPYGHTVTIRLDALERAEFARVRSLNTHAEWIEYWQRSIEPRIYELEGESIRGLRDGEWTYRLQNGAKYLDAEYKLGKRHGDWIIYYPDGTIRSKRHFGDGKPIDQSEYFDDRGTLLGSVEFENGVVPGSARSGSGRFGESRWFSAVRYEWGRGESVFVVNGNVVPRPMLPMELLTGGVALE